MLRVLRTKGNDTWALCLSVMYACYIVPAHVGIGSVKIVEGMVIQRRHAGVVMVMVVVKVVIEVMAVVVETVVETVLGIETIKEEW